jgi:hypothetical protein
MHSTRAQVGEGLTEEVAGRIPATSGGGGQRNRAAAACGRDGAGGPWSMVSSDGRRNRAAAARGPDSARGPWSMASSDGAA